MPRVPSYEPNQVPTQTARPNFARNNFDAGPAARTGRALSTVGSTLLDISLQEQRKADDTQLLEGNRNMSQWEIDNLDNPETGALAKKGKDALGLPDTILPAFDKRKSELAAGMNARAKARFIALADGRRQDIERKLFDHIGRQSEALNLAETEANESMALTEAAVNWRNPQRIETATDLGWAGRYARMNREGAPPEAIKVAREQWEGKVKGTVLDQMLANRDPLALDFYKQNRAALGTAADDYAKQVDRLQLQINETAEADRIIDKFGTGPAALAAARNIADPVLREGVEGRVDRQGVREERFRAEGERQISALAWSAAQRVPLGGSLEDVLSPKQIVQIDRVAGLRAGIDRELQRKLEGTATKTIPATYEFLQRLPPDELAKVDLWKYRGQLDAAAWDYFQDLQKKAQDPKKHGEIVTLQQQLNTYSELLGITGENNNEKRGKFERAATDALNTEQTAKGKPLSYAERQTVLDRLIVEGSIIKEWAQDPKGRVYELQERADFEQFEPKVPANERAKIEDMLRRKGAPVTEEAVVNYYKEKFGL